MNFNDLGRRILRWVKTILPELLGLSAFLTLWQLAAKHYSSVVLPSPLETLMALKNLVATDKLISAVLATTLHTFSGFAIAALFGSVLGISAGLQPWFGRSIAPAVTALQGIPPIAWIVLALLWFGSGSATSVFTVTVATLPVVFISAVEGMQTINTQLLEMASLFRAPKQILLLDLYLPHLLSYLFPSLAAGLGLAWRVGVMSELLSAETGIGAEINLARINLETAEVMAWIIVVVVLILTSEYLILRPLRRWLEPWRKSEKINKINDKQLA